MTVWMKKAVMRSKYFASYFIAALILSPCLLVSAAEHRVRGLQNVTSSTNANTTNANTTNANITNATTVAKPTFYFLVGPHKIGATFLITSLCQHHNVSETLLQRDHFVYLGVCFADSADPHQYITHDPLAVFTTRGTTNTTNTTNTNPYVELTATATYAETNTTYDWNNDFITRLHELTSATNVSNVLMIYEDASYFSDRRLGQLKNLLLPTWDVKIIVAHRYFHDWLLSVHHGQYGLHTPADYNDWNKQVAPFDLSNESLASTQIFLGVEKQQKHVSTLVAELYRRHFGSVVVVAIDPVESEFETVNATGAPFLQILFCRLLFATHACAAEQQGLLGGASNAASYQQKSSDTRTSLIFDLLAQKARQLNLVPDSTRRLALAQLIQDQLYFGFNETLSQLPVLCPDPVLLERFHNVSAVADSRVLRWSDPAVAAAHRDSFQTIAHQLCHVDADTVLTSTKWRDFFKQLVWK